MKNNKTKYLKAEELALVILKGIKEKKGFVISTKMGVFSEAISLAVEMERMEKG